MFKILLVEDDNNLREIYEARLQAEGYVIASAKDGEEALVVAKNEKPDLVIADVMMPKISGFEMLDILRNTDGFKDTKVIMLTALGQTEDKNRAESLGADRYLVKSQVTLEDIVKTAHELLGDVEPEVSTPATPGTEAAPTTLPPVMPFSQVPSGIDPAPTHLANSPSMAEPQTSVGAQAAATTPAIPPAAPTATAIPGIDDTAAPVAQAPMTHTLPIEEAEAASDAEPIRQEEREVEGQIDRFMNNPSPSVPPSPSADMTLPPVGQSMPPLSTAAPTADDNVMQNALNTLQASADANNRPSQVLAIDVSGKNAPADTHDKVAAEGPVSEFTAPDESNPSNMADSNPIAHKKVIQPLDSGPKPDINELLAKEQAKEQVDRPVVNPSTGSFIPPPTNGDDGSLRVAPPPNSNPMDPNNIAL